MNVIVNGNSKDCLEGISLAQFVADLGLKGDRIAVELNRKIVNRTRWTEIRLNEGDRLEIVHFVGGGATFSQTS